MFSWLNNYIFYKSIFHIQIIFRHLKLEFALAIPDLNELKMKQTIQYHKG